MGILDILSPSPTKNPYASMGLSDEAWQYFRETQRRQQIGQGLRSLGNTLSRAAYGLPPNAQAAAGRRGGGPQDEIMRMMKMQALIESRQDRDAKRQREEKQRADYQGLFRPPQGAVPAALAAGGGPTPRAAAQLGRSAPIYGMLPDAKPGQVELLRSLGRDLGAPLLAKQAFAKPKPGFTLSSGQTRYGPQGSKIASLPGVRKAPTTRRRIQGSTTIQEQFNPATGLYSEIGRGPRFKPAGAGGITLAQQRDNAEIDAARRELTASGMTREEILSRAQKATETGFDNPDFDPFIGRLVRAATQRKVGDDPEFEQFHRRIYGTTAPTDPSTADPAPTPSLGPAGTVSAPPRRTPPPTERELRRRSAGKPDIGETVVIGGKSFEVLSRDSVGRLTVLDLETGKQFFAR